MFDVEEFHSILWPSRSPRGALPPGDDLVDDVVRDLALDQAFSRMLGRAPNAEVALRAPLASVDAVRFRQEVFQVLETGQVRAVVDAFLGRMHVCDTQDDAARKARLRYEDQLWHLAAVTSYVSAAEGLRSGLEAHDHIEWGSGWGGLLRYLMAMEEGESFQNLKASAERVNAALAAVRYNALLRYEKVVVAPVDDEPDLEEYVLSVFARFRSEGAAARRSVPPEAERLGHVQGWMLERVAQIYPQPFAELEAFCHSTAAYRDQILDRFSDEVRFYLSYLDYVAPMRATGLPLCYPVVSDDDKQLDARDCWDLVLGSRLVESTGSVVTNDLALTGRERILVISGPNQGGKTTGARMVGQLHYLAALGCPVPGSRACVHLCDRVLTVFDRAERLDSLEGRLGEEVKRVHDILELATGDSLVVINEAFSSTALHDARLLTRDVLERLSRRDALAVCVTFIDELSRLDEKTVSLVSEVDPSDPTVRTYRLTRRFADGRVYARVLAAAHGLTREQIERRLAGPVAGEEQAS